MPGQLAELVEVVLRGGPAHGLGMVLTRPQIHLPITREGWPNAYQWFLDEDVDDQGRPVFRCEVPHLVQFSFIISPMAIAQCSFDLIAYVERDVAAKVARPGDVCHIRWEATDEEGEYHKIDPRITADLPRYTMLKCGGTVIKDRYALDQPEAGMHGVQEAPEV